MSMVIHDIQVNATNVAPDILQHRFDHIIASCNNGHCQLTITFLMNVHYRDEHRNDRCNHFTCCDSYS